MNNQNRILKRLAVPGTLAAAALVLAACGGGDDGESTTVPSSDSTVSAAAVDGRTVLVNAGGNALYTTDEEQASGDVLCISDGCLAFWEPLTIDSGTPTGDATGKLGVVARPDGSDQVTLDGDPLYTFTNDAPGQITGDGLTDTFDGQTLTWHVVTTSDSSGTADQGGGYDY